MTSKFFGSLGNFAEIAVGLGLIVRGYSRLKANGSALPLGRAAVPMARNGNGQAVPLFAPDKTGRMAPTLQRGAVITSAVLKPIGNIDERVKYIQAAIRRDSLSPVIKEAALKVLTRKCGDQWCIPEKDYLREVSSLFWAVKNPASPIAMRYVRDHVDVDQFTSAEKTMQLHGGDCFPANTLLLTKRAGLMPIRDVQIGDEIWGLDKWTKVLNKWDKSILDTWGIRLSNGRLARLTPNHKVWIPLPALHRVDVSDMPPGTVLMQPPQVPLCVGSKLPQWWWSLHQAERIAGHTLAVDTLFYDKVRVHCYDIATEDHYVYLPESDWTVSNCDDSTIYLGSLLRSVGYPVQLRVIQDIKNDTWSHIFMRAGTPPPRPDRWIPLDTTVHGAYPGWEVPGAEESKRTGKPAGYVTRVKDYPV